MKVVLDAPNVGETEKKYLCQAIDSGFVSSVGPCIAEFEKKVADYLGVQGAVGVQSGTSAIYMALYELGIGPGDEVIVPALTFAATINPVLYTGATPVIVDVDLKTWTIHPGSIKQAITAKTKAIIPVHLYGNPCDMTEIMNIASENGISVVEDATESLGATFNGRHMGTLGDFGCLSFNGNKLITTGGGGMIVSNNADTIKHIRLLVNQSKDEHRPGFHAEMGFNFRMTNIEAALGLAQWEKMEGFLNKKRAFKKSYREVLGDLPGVRFPQPYSNAQESGWMSCIMVENVPSIEGLIDILHKKSVPTRRVFMPLNEMPYLKPYASDCPNSAAIYNQGLCLPSSMLNEENDIKEAALTIREEIQ